MILDLRLLIYDFRFTPELNSGLDLLLTHDMLANGVRKQKSKIVNLKSKIVNPLYFFNNICRIFVTCLIRLP
jgi:hypothetical protein